jgi:hypothetical protein
MIPKCLEIQKVEPPPELAAALTPDFIQKLKIEKPPPVLMMDGRGKGWGGFCSGKEYTQDGEIVVSARPMAEPAREIWRLRSVYMHEIVHRFLSEKEEGDIGGSHGVVFFTLLLLVLKRAGGRRGEEGGLWADSIDFYDFHDVFEEEESDVYTAGEALDFSIRVSDQLYTKNLSCEAAADVIAARFSSWKNRLAGRPAREQKREMEKKAMVAAVKTEKKKKKEVWGWVAWSGALNIFLLTIIFSYLV